MPSLISRVVIVGGCLTTLLCTSAVHARCGTLQPTLASRFATPLPVLDSVQKRSDTVLTKDPTTAVLWSLLFPGLGQLYVESYWKIPLFTGAAAGTIGLFIWNNSKYQDAQQRYDDAVASGASSTVISSLQREKEYYRDNRDLSGGIFVLTYVLAAVDAYVGAHLYDFNVNDDLTVRVVPTTLGGVTASMAVRF